MRRHHRLGFLNAAAWLRSLCVTTGLFGPALWAEDNAGQVLLDTGKSQYAQQQFIDAERSYTDAIALLERQLGATSPQLVAPLLALADTLVASQLIADAVEPLRRAINIVRRSAGVYDQQQFELLLRVVDVQSQIGAVEEAAADLAYMQRISESSHAGNPLQYGRALAEIAGWQCRIGRFVESRETYRQSIDALERITATEPLVASLRGFARCSLQELAAQGVATRSDSLDMYRGPIRRAELNPSNPAFRLHVFRFFRPEGEQALQRAVQLSEALDAKLHIEVLLEAGDWFLAKDYAREARRFYIRAEALARAGGAEDALLVPEQVLYPMPATALRNRHLAAADTTELYVEVEFTVRGDGHIVDERVIERGPGLYPVKETLQAMGVARYRPRIVAGEALMTEGVRFRQPFRQLKDFK